MITAKTKNGAPKISEPIRWSLVSAASEYGVSAITIRSGLKKHGIPPGLDQRFSTQQIAKALFDPEAHDASMKAAKAQKAIDEAEMVHNNLLLQRGTLLRTSTVRV